MDIVFSTMENNWNMFQNFLNLKQIWKNVFENLKKFLKFLNVFRFF